MILDYLLWLSSWPVLIICWLLENLLSSRNLGPSQTTPVRYLESQSIQPNRMHPEASTLNRTRASEAPESRAEQYGPYPINSTLTEDASRSDAPSDCLARLLEIIPDVEPGHATRLITAALTNYSQAEALGHVLHSLFEKPIYPKVNRSKSAKRADRQSHGNLVNTGSSSNMNFHFGYGNKSRPFRGGPDYAELALRYLQKDFPSFSEGYLRESLNSLNGLYAPTHVFLLDRRRDIKLPVNVVRKNGKHKELHDEEFDKEREWILEVMAESDQCMDGIECGCCFAQFRFRKMIQCPETHLFCSSCMRAYASPLLGMQNPDIKCLDLSGCNALIPESELRRFLPDEMMRLWERARQRKDIQSADLKGLEDCPFCDYSVIIESAEERLLRCGNKEVCGVVSCRACKKPDHLPLRCGEEEEDRNLGGRHIVEEAMSRALVRSCPFCNRSIVKTDGCNSMTCVCGQTWCYVCRQRAIGRHHSTCHQEPEASDKLHAKEVKAAQDRAVQEVKRRHPYIDEKKIRVSLT